MRIAAFDLGSNSFHLILVETRPDGSFVPVAKEREMLRLGDLVASKGAFGREGFRRAYEVVRRFKTIADTHGADEIIAVGTSAMREANDGPAFVDAVRRRLGIEIHIIDGIEEATTIFTAVRASVVLDPAPALAADLGGGSLELMLGDASELRFAASVKLGVGRLTAQFFHSDPPSAQELDDAEHHVERELRAVLDEISDYAPKLFVVSSGTFIAIATIAAALRDGALPAHINHLTVRYEDVQRAKKRVLAEAKVDRSKIPGVDARRSELLPAGFVVLCHLMRALSLPELTVSGWALREGLVLRAIERQLRRGPGTDPRNIRRASVLELCRRCNWNRDHAMEVAELSTRLFDETTERHRLEPESRELLEFAALLHDIGEHVSRVNHDRHSAYLIEHGGLRGFSPEEIRLLMTLVRFHVRGSEKAMAKFAALSTDRTEELAKLTGILRIADALDASHKGRVKALRLRWLSDVDTELVLTADTDAELELWSFRKKRALFERTLEIRVEPVLDPRSLRHLMALETDEVGLG